MASGLDTQVGWDLESTWGTRVAPTHFPRIRTVNVMADDTWVQGEGIQSGQQFAYQGHLVRTITDATFNLAFDYQTRDCVGLFNTFFGGSISAVQQGGTPAYLHTFSSLGTLTNKAATIQTSVARQQSTTTDPIEISGAKVTELEINHGYNELLQITMSGGGKLYDTAQTLATASYNASEVAPHTGVVFKQGTYGAEASLSGARAFNCKLARPQNFDDNGTFGNTRTEPEANNFATIEGSFEVDYLSTTLTALWRAGTSTSLVYEWTGSQISGAYYQIFRLTLSSVKLQGPGPSQDGPALARIPWTFVGGYDGTNPAVKLEIINTETSTTGY